jgi:hypothetical protein
MNAVRAEYVVKEEKQHLTIDDSAWVSCRADILHATYTC